MAPTGRLKKVSRRPKLLAKRVAPKVPWASRVLTSAVVLTLLVWGIVYLYPPEWPPVFALAIGVVALAVLLPWLMAKERPKRRGRR